LGSRPTSSGKNCGGVLENAIEAVKKAKALLEIA
jgi:hypothetical protein